MDLSNFRSDWSGSSRMGFKYRGGMCGFWVEMMLVSVAVAVLALVDPAEGSPGSPDSSPPRTAGAASVAAVVGAAAAAAAAATVAVASGGASSTSASATHAAAVSGGGDGDEATVEPAPKRAKTSNETEGTVSSGDVYWGDRSQLWNAEGRPWLAAALERLGVAVNMHGAIKLVVCRDCGCAIGASSAAYAYHANQHHQGRGRGAEDLASLEEVRREYGLAATIATTTPLVDGVDAIQGLTRGAWSALIFSTVY